MDKKPQPIAVDFDGIAWDFLAALQRQPECTPEIAALLDPAVCDQWGIPFDYLGLEVMERARSLKLIREIGLFPGFVSTMKKLQEWGFQPTILSHNSEETLKNLNIILKEEGLELECLRARPKDKIQWCKDNQAAGLIDDAPETIQLAEDAGITSFTFRYPYNAKVIDATNAIWVDFREGWPGLEKKLGRRLLRPSLQPPVAQVNGGKVHSASVDLCAELD